MTLIYCIIILVVGFFIGMAVAMITTGNCKIMKKFKKSGEPDLYKYVMENEADNPNLKSMDVKNKENKE